MDVVSFWFAVLCLSVLVGVCLKQSGKAPRVVKLSDKRLNMPRWGN